MSREDDSWEIGFVLERDNDVDREEIDDVAMQFEALQEHRINCRVKVVIDGGKLDWPGAPARVIFRRREG